MTVKTSHDGLLWAMCSNAGFLFLSTVLRLVALQSHFTWTPHREDYNSSIDVHDSAPQRKGSEQAAVTAAAHLGRMDAVIFDSAPAPLTSHMASRYVFIHGMNGNMSIWQCGRFLYGSITAVHVTAASDKPVCARQ